MSIARPLPRPSERLATPALWFEPDGQALTQLVAHGWLSAETVSTVQMAFAVAFDEYASNADFGMLKGHAGMVPHSRHYPGRYDDDPFG